VVVTGVPGSGKSTFMLNMLANLSRTEDFRSMLFVPENEAHLQEKMQRIWGDRPGFDRFCAEQCWVQSAVADDYEAPAQTLNGYSTRRSPASSTRASIC
jgi:predicted ATPase